MELQPLEGIHSAAWDKAISGYQSRLIFHQSAWLGFLEETHGGRLLRFRLVENGVETGYFAGLIVKKGVFSMLGSPLTGWTTDLMGPIANQDLDRVGFLRAIEKTCHRLGVDFLQIGSPLLPPDLMAGEGFDVIEMKTFAVPLSSSKDEMWDRLSSKCRNRIRKGLKNGLVVQNCDDEGFVEDYYNQHIEVFGRQGLPPKYSVQLVRNLFGNLKSKSQLMALRVLQGERAVATGLFPHDDRSILSFGIASRGQDLHLCPNELLYWTAMCLAGDRGLKELWIGGNYRTPHSGGNFKQKFNGREVTLHRYTKSFSLPARLAHHAYRLFLASRNRFPRLLAARRVQGSHC